MLFRSVSQSRYQYEKADRLFKSLDFEIQKFLIIDNGNNPNWHPVVDCAKETYVYKIPNNLGVAGSWNFGIKATAKFYGWMILNDDIYFRPGALKDFFSQAAPDNIVECGGFHAFWLGCEVVKKIGIFHEGFHPAYYEDTDYTMRARYARINILQSNARVIHEHSSTVKSSENYRLKNQHITWQHNKTLYAQRAINPEKIALEWDLQKRLELGWD